MEVATLVRRFLEHGVRSVIQCRVDGVVACLPKKEHKRAMELNEEAWPCGVKKLKDEKIYANHRTLIPAHHVFNPICEPISCTYQQNLLIRASDLIPNTCQQNLLIRASDWQDLTKEQARAHMKAGGCILVQGQGGTGKTTFCSEVLPEMEGWRIIACGKRTSRRTTSASQTIVRKRLIWGKMSPK